MTRNILLATTMVTVVFGWPIPKPRWMGIATSHQWPPEWTWSLRSLTRRNAHAVNR